MKHFTRLFILASLLISSSALNAQTYDLAVTDLIITPATATGNLPVNIPLYMIATVTNAGTTIIPDQTTLTIYYTVDGDTIETWNTMFNGALNPGANAAAVSNSFVLNNPVPTDFCAAAILTVLTDNNLANNFSCETNVNVGTAANVDLSADSIAIVAPTNLDSFDIDNNTEIAPNITEVEFFISNQGNVTYPSGYPLSFVLYLDEEEIVISGGLNGALAPGASITVSVEDAASLFDAPQEVGLYNLCGVVPTDQNSDNDTTCVGFTIIDTYIPPEPVGVAEVNTNDYNVTFNNDFIAVSNVNSHLNASIIDMNGRVIANEMIVEDKRISTSTLNAGVYFLQTVNEKTGEVKMNKFSKF